MATNGYLQVDVHAQFQRMYVHVHQSSFCVRVLNVGSMHVQYGKQPFYATSLEWIEVYIGYTQYKPTVCITNEANGLKYNGSPTTMSVCVQI